MYTVRTGYSIRHIAVAPNDDVYFNINGNYQGKQYKVTNEVLVSGNGGNTSSTFETIVGNGSWGALPAIGYSGSANISVGTGNLDGSPNGMCYDPYRGRLYFSISADKRLYYLRNSSVPAN
jgi:restriction endonuclease S subunit